MFRHKFYPQCLATLQIQPLKKMSCNNIKYLTKSFLGEAVVHLTLEQETTLEQYVKSVLPGMCHEGCVSRGGPVPMRTMGLRGGWWKGDCGNGMGTSRAGRKGQEWRWKDTWNSRARKHREACLCFGSEGIRWMEPAPTGVEMDPASWPLHSSAVSEYL